ncbi:LysR family transcriptional regulator [Shewanella sp.]|uniref:LysR family transcriptional regulator n=1 Tax=Shewanella sp. TaxID=50422 RepID=UPI0035693AE0
MYSHLPSLNGLRVFEAAARHLSFKMAATELQLTPTAVSHQIRNLEAHLDMPLFIRHTRAVELTPAGQTLFETSRQVLRQIDQTLTGLGVGRQSLTINAAQGFASLWLAQHLPDFQNRYPDLRVSVSQSDEPAIEATDINITRQSPATSPPALKLPEQFGLYASPAYLARKQTHQTLMQVRHQSQPEVINWQSWQQAYGTFREAQLIEFDREDQLLQACLAGQGLALTSSLLVSTQVENGWLKPCLPEKVLSGSGYQVITSADNKRAVRLLLEWLSEQLGITQTAV